MAHGDRGSKLIRVKHTSGVADTVEAMTSHRPYRPAVGLSLALEEIERGRGVLYDPKVVDACLHVFRKGRFAFD